MTRPISLAALAVAVIVAVAAWMWLRPDPEAGAAADTAQAAGEDSSGAEAEKEWPPIPDMVLGDPDAPLTIVEYASFTCPHCKNFHEGAFGEFKEAYVDTGKVHFIFREVFSNRYGLWAGMVARCGGQERYFAIVDMIFEKQSEWPRAGSDEEVIGQLMTFGRLAGLTTDELNACLKDGDAAQAMIAQYKEHTERDGITSTPSLLIGDDLETGNKTFDALSKLVDAKLEELGE